MPKAIVIEQTGGPEVMRYSDVTVPDPGPGEIRIRHSAIGLNFIDVYFRTGLYPAPSLPFTPGMEAAGVVTAVGPGVSDLTEGDRVAYASPPLGSYAQERVMPADRVVALPDQIDDAQAASMMLKGMTAQYLLRRTYRVQRGDVVLIHAAAGGVGLIACQWAKHLGATVIGTVGSQEKADLAKSHGCDHPILYRSENVVERVRDITGGEGVPVVYDSVGKDTFDASLECLAPMGTMVLFGASSGPVPTVEVAKLAPKSLFFTRPSLINYNAKRADLAHSAKELFDVVASGAVKVGAARTYALSDAAQAHIDLEARKTTGSTILLP